MGLCAATSSRKSRRGAESWVVRSRYPSSRSATFFVHASADGNRRLTSIPLGVTFVSSWPRTISRNSRTSYEVQSVGLKDLVETSIFEEWTHRIDPLNIIDGRNFARF
jgi:hypothetical protein